MSTANTILIVQTTPNSSLLSKFASQFDCKQASSIKEALRLLEDDWIQVLLCQLELAMANNAYLLNILHEKWPEIEVCLVRVDEPASMLKSTYQRPNIFALLEYSWPAEHFKLILKQAANTYELKREKELLEIEKKVAPQKPPRAHSPREIDRLLSASHSDGLVRSANSPINEVCERINLVANYDISVLILGESGTGKELAARALHFNSPRWDQAFVVENCGALPDELLESELFGYRKGAFTGAVEDRIGLFERANGGTIFLDEIGDISPAFQVKLLRVLQEGELRPLGSGELRKVDLRVIAASNKNLEEEVRAGRFREDLYYRLAGFSIHMPALQERRQDIPVLAKALLRKAINSLGKHVKGFTDETLACMQAYHWPGNVRELQNEIQQMLVMGNEELLGAELLSPRVLQAAPREESPHLQLLNDLDGSLKERMESLEAKIIQETLIRHRWNKSQAARELGLSRVGLRSKLDRYGLEKNLLSPHPETLN